MQVIGLQPRISKYFLDHYIEQFFITVGQNNFGKIEIILELGCVCACAAHQENVYDVRADADENPRTLKVKK